MNGRPRYGHPPCGQVLQTAVTPSSMLPWMTQFEHEAPAQAQVTGPVPQVDSVHIVSSAPPCEMAHI
jgi:hypothetical protein